MVLHLNFFALTSALGFSPQAYNSLQIEEDIAVETLMARKRLLIVTHTFLPHVGGIERVVYEQGKRLMRRGFDVTVLTSRMNTPESYVVDGIKVRCYDSLNAAFGLGIPYPIPQINSFKPFLKCVNAERPRSRSRSPIPLIAVRRQTRQPHRQARRAHTTQHVHRV